jgi:hypothetical protein
MVPTSRAFKLTHRECSSVKSFLLEIPLAFTDQTRKESFVFVVNGSPLISLGVVLNGGGNASGVPVLWGRRGGTGSREVSAATKESLKKVRHSSFRRLGLTRVLGGTGSEGGSSSCTDCSLKEDKERSCDRRDTSVPIKEASEWWSN